MMTPKFLLWRPSGYRDFVLKGLPHASVGAELGVYRGDFSARILKVVRPRRLYLVDPWTRDVGIPSRLWGARSTQASLDDARDAVRSRFRAEIAAGTVVERRIPSVDFAAEVPDGSLDWIYLDADHREDAVLRDLTAIWPKIRPGGVLLGDDYDRPNSRFEDGVTKGVHRFVAAGPGAPLERLRRHQYRFVKPSPGAPASTTPPSR